MFSRIALFTLLALLSAPQDAQAYLGLIRQGAESAGVPNAFDHYGETIATGDFNGDGYEDIAVASPDESNAIGGADHGVVIVSYGSEFGIVHTGADQLTPGDPGDFNYYFGRGLAAGDFNGDGTDDLAVGIPGADYFGDQDVGAVWIYAGVQGDGISLAPYAQLMQDDCGATVEAGDQFGYTLEAGDMTLDGFADLFVGSIGEDNDAGLVGFFKGSAAGIVTTGSGFAKQSGLGGVDGAGDLFGYSLALGNFVDDDHLDIAIGTPKGDDNSLLDMGKVYIVRGTALGPVGPAAEILTPLSLGVPLQLGRLFGWSLAAGSFLDENGSRPDLAIGEPHYYSDGVVTSGRVVVVDYDGQGDNIHTGPKLIDQGTLGEPITPGAGFGWALAAGNIMTKDGIAGPDGMDDLAIGAPLDDVPVPDAGEAMFWDNVGSAYIVPGTHSSFAYANTKVIDAMERNDLWFGFDEQLGKALAFGKFDDSGWDNLAIGVPNKMYPAFIDPDTDKVEAGLVYIMAPWRQPQGKPHRSSIVQDCADRILYAQRMGQRLTPASTTKAMTALLAAEAIDDGLINPNGMYQVPAWCANKVTGSQYGLVAGEWMSFIDLVRVMIAVSGNDAAYTVGNILQGETAVWDYGQSTAWNLPVVLSDFATMMNNRATQMGMSAAHTFNNPAGRPYGNHWTTAQDMAIFVGEAMQNATFRGIVGVTNWPAIQRILPINVLFPWINAPGVYVPFVDSVSNGYFSAIKQSDPRATGVKGGSNGPSMATGLYSAEVLNGYVKCTIFGVPPYGWLRDLGFELMSLVDSACEPAQVTPAFPVPDTFAVGQNTNIPLDPDRAHGTSAELEPGVPNDLCVDILRADMTTPTTCAEATILRTSERDLAPGETRHMSCSNNLKQIGIALHNTGDQIAYLTVEVPALGMNHLVDLDPGEKWILGGTGDPFPGQGGLDVIIGSTGLNNMGGSGNDVLLGNRGNDIVLIEVQELYGFELTLGEDRNTPPDWKTVLRRDGIVRHETIRTIVRGCGPADGNTVHVSMHDFNSPTPVEEPTFIPTAAGVLSSLDNYPNPFNPRTTISFELQDRAQIAVRIYDLAGRLVRVLERGRMLQSGAHKMHWDGSDDGGRTVASGVYLVQVDDGIAAKAKRVTLLK